jgi:hypothetical protein
VVNDFGSISHLASAQISGRGFAGFTIGDEIERNLLSLAEAVQPGALDGTDVDEYILAAVSRLDEAKSLLAVEPLYGSLRHKIFLSDCARICAGVFDRTVAQPV